ncbi:MAG: tyrosine--tRNA ligase [Spirochaetaceae bacterium]
MILEELRARGFFQQCTDFDALGAQLEKEPTTAYVGVDPTGPSLHAGHLVPIMAMIHFARAGHKPIILIGGGTAKIGDPSGKTEIRKMQTEETIAGNAAAIRKQIEDLCRSLDVDLTFLNNAEWLDSLNYIAFLRDIGRHFSVNRMLSFETYKRRLETGLSFIEFNYQLLQSYDFLVLHDRHGCRLQVGGDDQWGNIVAGADLIRRTTGDDNIYGLTFPLVTRADGKKMGKTEEGAVFLDPALFPPYDFFQYWRNVPDSDVRRFLCLYTFLPMTEIDALASGDINQAKERLAYELTRLIHGETEATAARDAAKAAFSDAGGGDRSAIPATPVDARELDGGIPALEVFTRSGLSASKSEARRLIRQGGARINDRKIENEETLIDATWLESGELLLRAGKKRYHRMTVDSEEDTGR